MLNYIKQQTDALREKYFNNGIRIRRYMFDKYTYDLLRSKGIEKIDNYTYTINLNAVKNTCNIVGDNVIMTINLVGERL